MAKFTNTPPDWTAEGTAPPNSLKTSGFVAGYKPPAAYFNWFWTKVSKCIAELQTKLGTAEDKLSGVEDNATAVGQKQYDGETLQGEIFNNYSGQGKNNASGVFSHAEGTGTTASGQHAHAENYQTIASGMGSHAEGLLTKANGAYSHAENYQTTADGNYSHASGVGTVAYDYQFVAGRYNNLASAPTSESDTEGSLFIVGCGTNTATANALRITTAGKCYGSQSFGASGADFAEMFEWCDGNTNNEDRRGLFVTLDGDKIKLANSDDDYILGVVSATPTVIGDTASEEWHGKYKTDVFGNRLTETVNVEGTTETRFILNDDYISDKEYKSREERKEWASIGLIGKLVVTDDGTCEVNGYCKSGNNGIATKATAGYRVLKRIDNNHIRILYK